MSKNSQGYMGPQIGKLGPAIGYLWKGRQVFRGYNPFVKDRNSEKQQLVRTRFKAVNSLMNSIGAAVNLGSDQPWTEKSNTRDVRYRTRDYDMEVGCWGGGVIMSPEQLSPSLPVSPIDNAKDLKCPLLGIFGNDDKHPDPQEVDKTEEVLKLYEKNYEFHRYDGAGHGFWYYDKAMYRQEQAMDSFNKVIAFFDQYLK